MKDVMEVGGHNAMMAFDADTNLFRGEFIDLDGGADFYAADLESLRIEGEISYKVFFDMCREDVTHPVAPPPRGRGGADVGRDIKASERC